MAFTISKAATRQKKAADDATTINSKQGAQLGARIQAATDQIDCSYTALPTVLNVDSSLNYVCV